MTVLERDMVFAPESIEFRDEIQDRFAALLRKKAIQRARTQERREITRQDFEASLEEAWREAVREFLS